MYDGIQDIRTRESLERQRGRCLLTSIHYPCVAGEPVRPACIHYTKTVPILYCSEAVLVSLQRSRCGWAPDLGLIQKWPLSFKWIQPLFCVLDFFSLCSSSRWLLCDSWREGPMWGVDLGRTQISPYCLLVRELVWALTGLRASGVMLDLSSWLLSTSAPGDSCPHFSRCSGKQWPTSLLLRLLLGSTPPVEV